MEDVCAYKGLEAYNQFVSGWVHEKSVYLLTFNPFRPTYVNICTGNSVYKYGPISPLVGFVVTLSERGIHAQC